MTQVERPTKDASSRSAKPDPIKQVLQRNREIDKRKDAAVNTTVIVIGCLILSLAGNVLLGTRPPPEPRYIVAQMDGTLVPIIPLNLPVTNENAVIQLVGDAVSQSNAINFLHFRKQLNDASTFFTRRGWTRYEAALAQSGNLDLMQSKKLTLQAVIQEPPVVLRRYTVGDIFAWDVDVVYQVIYQGQGFQQSQANRAIVTVVRIPTTENPRGIAIAGFNSKRLQ